MTTPSLLALRTVFSRLFNRPTRVNSLGSGGVIRDGIDGFIVPIRDSDTIIACLERFPQETDLLAAQAAAARQRAGEFTLEQYRQRLLAAINTRPGIPG